MQRLTSDSVSVVLATPFMRSNARLRWPWTFSFKFTALCTVAALTKQQSRHATARATERETVDRDHQQRDCVTLKDCSFMDSENDSRTILMDVADAHAQSFAQDWTTQSAIDHPSKAAHTGLAELSVLMPSNTVSDNA